MTDTTVTFRLVDAVRNDDWESVFTVLGLGRKEAVDDVADDFGREIAALVDRLAGDVTYAEASSMIGDYERDKLKYACERAFQGEVVPSTVAHDIEIAARSAWSYSHYFSAVDAVLARSVADGQYTVVSTSDLGRYQHRYRFANYGDADLYLRFVNSTDCHGISRVWRLR